MTGPSVTVTGHRPLGASLAELWQRRELMYFLAWRHVLVRYRQTFFGILWSVFRPLIATLILVLVFHRFIGLQSGPVPYPLVVLSGLLLWNLFSHSVSAGGSALVAEQALVTRTYVPRMILPLSAMLVNFIEAGITFMLMLVVAWYDGAAIAWQAVLAPVFAALVFCLAAGFALIFTALHARYRDFIYITPFFLQMGFYLSPIAFPASSVPENVRWLYDLNPMVGLVEAFRWSLFRGLDFPFFSFACSLAIGAALLWAALFFFLRNDRTVADVI